MHRLDVNFIFSNAPTSVAHSTVLKNLGTWSQVHTEKWDAQKSLKICKDFLQNDNYNSNNNNNNDNNTNNDTNTEKINEKLQITIDDTTINKQNTNEYNNNSTFMLDENDRIIVSGPKPFVDNFLEGARLDEELRKVNIGKQIICMD